MDVSVCGDVIVTDHAVIVGAPDPSKRGTTRAGARVAGEPSGAWPWKPSPARAAAEAS